MWGTTEGKCIITCWSNSQWKNVVRGWWEILHASSGEPGCSEPGSRAGRTWLSIHISTWSRSFFHHLQTTLLCYLEEQRATAIAWLTEASRAIYWSNQATTAPVMNEHNTPPGNRLTQQTLLQLRYRIDQHQISEHTLHTLTFTHTQLNQIM